MSEERKQINYTVACVNEFAHEHNMTVKDAFQFLFEYKAIAFLKENYDIEHTLSLDDALSDMLLICQKNGGDVSMILYHGTNIDIQSIDLALCRPYKDFGRGFYTTDILEQAQKMAKRVAKIYGGNAIVNMYEIEDDFIENKELNTLDLGKIPSERWAVFVMNNRSKTFTDIGSPDCNLDCKYDIVSGSIADDDMTMLFRQYQNNMITLQTLVGGMTFRKTTSQYSFHTEKAVNLLRKVGVLQ